MKHGNLEPTKEHGRGHFLVLQPGMLGNISGIFSSFKSFVSHLHSKMHYYIPRRDGFSHSLMTNFADLYLRMFMKDTKGGCIFPKREIPTLHGVRSH